MKVGVLALQGAFVRHIQALDDLGAAATEVRTVGELSAVDALVLPGGESTTMSMLLDSSGLRTAVAERIDGGMPVLGTCAGMILLASHVADGRPDQRSFAAIDIDVRRNGYGRQVDSFESDLDVTGLDEPFHGVFIRAPVVDRVGNGVEVLASVDGRPVLCSQGSVVVTSFHPEMSGDGRIHGKFLDMAFAA
ncbi:MAG: pyridoxal 5'-phosphate synthase glutaminase subunit PdxT [Acidimicrobiales bacterium]|jgi:5'-phosphate synthase pdxT subunit|nr:pyridoxal 5'-phosphate synthase glutaminase subunit PdxT [Actinomycetes bacterium]MDP6286730.1 pyridoxal 5'-phosphate synthase glutaminase subunit PdxT [Acidimicrobiales bacterium]MDP6910176.1 pyridoxal 5'-phosphate synthase glutaminase subunit PdxT [Acidimicrobiales bacterium]HCW00308.1 pyridoxal 5'-phosphate synthase glutaminase subunit PdxT [Acidimicrobiaceae bacterium]HJM73718.1 pyridoxal 5'-phosphate synthase glutaminase subunit PdxT [Acidimicrobiales bacterium]|tara:strand:+ start:3928 stop:4503 length:576 start_codon:yes stop_codon:yes gene_type:complete